MVGLGDAVSAGIINGVYASRHGQHLGDGNILPRAELSFGNAEHAKRPTGFPVGRLVTYLIAIKLFMIISQSI